jgi:hypothetical protein
MPVECQLHPQKNQNSHCNAVVEPRHVTVPAEMLLREQRTLCCDTALQEHAIYIALFCDATMSRPSLS